MRALRFWGLRPVHSADSLSSHCREAILLELAEALVAKYHLPHDGQMRGVEMKIAKYGLNKAVNDGFAQEVAPQADAGTSWQLINAVRHLNPFRAFNSRSSIGHRTPPRLNVEEVVSSIKRHAQLLVLYFRDILLQQAKTPGGSNLVQGIAMRLFESAHQQTKAFKKTKEGAMKLLSRFKSKYRSGMYA
jgi:hypothetical protein